MGLPGHARRFYRRSFAAQRDLTPRANNEVLHTTIIPRNTRNKSATSGWKMFPLTLISLLIEMKKTFKRFSELLALFIRGAEADPVSPARPVRS
jgi:hypothetical protein